MVKILTDDSWDLPDQITAQYTVDVLPIKITENDREYIIGENLSIDEFYEKQRAGSIFGTSQVTPAQVREKFVQAAEAGQPCIFIPLSTGISSTYNNSLLIKEQVLEEYPQAQIEVINTKSASLGHGLIGLKGAQMAAANQSFEEIVQELQAMSQVMEHFFTVGSLDYLHQGGRVSKGVQLMGGLLKIMPLMTVNKENGILELVEPVRGKKNLFKKYKDQMLKKCKNQTLDPNQTIGIVHGDWPEMFQELKDFLVTDLNFPEENILESRIGVAIGAHTGPEVFAVMFLSDTDYR